MKIRFYCYIILIMSVITLSISGCSNKILEKNAVVQETKVIELEKELSQDKENDIEIEYDQDGVIKKEIAKEIIEKRSKVVIDLLSKEDMEGLSQYIHPVKGVRFTPYTYINIDKDRIVTRKEILSILSDTNVYVFGVYDGIGDDIQYTWMDYYKEFVYSKDYMNAERIGYNEVLSSGNMIDNTFDVYEDAIVVEYYFSGFNIEYGGADWRSLKIVYEEYDGEWYMVGIIHNQWTV